MTLHDFCARRATALAVFVIALAVAVAYRNSFCGWWVFDDESGIVRNPYIRSLWPPDYLYRAQQGNLTGGRPLVALSFAVNYAFQGIGKTWGYHAFNLGVHFLAAFALFGIVRRTLPRIASLPPISNASATGLSLVSALLWAVHPLQTESVTYISTRTESMMGLFYLLTLYAFLRLATDRAHQRLWSTFCVLACVCSMLCKETAATAPLMVLLFDRAFLAGAGGFSEAIRRRKGLYAALAGTWIVTILLFLSVVGERTHAIRFHPLEIYRYALTQTGLVLHYLRLSVWPRGLTVDYFDWPIARGVGDVLPEAVVVGAMLCATVWGMRRRPQAAFLGCWIFLLLAPTSLVPMRLEVGAERRMYLPLAAVAVLAALLAGRGIDRMAGAVAARGLGPFLKRWTAAAAVLALTLLTVDRNYDYGDNFILYEDAVAKRPGNARAHVNLGTVLDKLGRREEAEHHYRESLRLDPDAAATHYNLGTLLASRGRLDEADRHLRESIRLNPNSATTRNEMANLLRRRGRPREAVREYRKAIDLMPAWAEPQATLALVLAAHPDEALRDPREALALAQTAKNLSPHAPLALHALGAALARNGRYGEAIGLAREAARLAAKPRNKPLLLAAHQALRCYEAGQPFLLSE